MDMNKIFPYIELDLILCGIVVDNGFDIIERNPFWGKTIRSALPCPTAGHRSGDFNKKRFRVKIM
jgi:hypothetical protein